MGLFGGSESTLSAIGIGRRPGMRLFHGVEAALAAVRIGSR
jgi:hypothetical protein